MRPRNSSPCVTVAVPCVGELAVWRTRCDYDHGHAKAEWEGMSPNGFQFDGTEAHDIDYALNQGIDLFTMTERRSAPCKRCMSCDFSWNRPALDYIELYHAARK